MFGSSSSVEYGKDECLVWDKEFWPEASPYFPIIAYNAFIYISLFSIWRLVFEGCIDSGAVKYAQSQKLNKWNKADFEVNRKKYKESIFKTVTNSVLMFYGFYVIWWSPYFWNPSLLFISWPQPMNVVENIYYRLAIGYHGHRAIYGLFWEKKRADFVAYVLHHWVTVLLIVGSWSVGLSQHGVIVMFLHDSADVFLSSSKTCSYNNNRIGVILSFSLFTLSWIGCRLLLYPLKIIYPVLLYRTKYDCHPLYWIFILLLTILLILHIYWGRIIVGYLYYMITKPKGNECMHDPRSDGDDDHHHHHHIKNGYKKS